MALGEAPPAHEKVPHDWKSLGESRAALIAALSEGPSLDEETEVSSWKEAADKLTGESQSHPLGAMLGPLLVVS